MNRIPNQSRGLMASLQFARQVLAVGLSTPRGELEAPAGLRLCPVGLSPEKLTPLLINQRTERIVRRVYPLRAGLGVLWLSGLLGCVGYVDGGYGGGVIVPGPDFYIFGGGYERGREVHEYHDRGERSREAAHPRGREERH